MDPRPDHNQAVRRVMLPSGKTIEVVYFPGDQTASPDRAMAARFGRT